jgi:hypothetical protein
LADEGGDLAARNGDAIARLRAMPLSSP